jgi:hypothetical protein
MSTNYEFDYEFKICNCSFPNGDVNCTTGHCGLFSETYALCTLPDVSSTRYEKIIEKIDELLKLISQIEHLRVFSSFIKIDEYRYKISVTNESFVNFL